MSGNDGLRYIIDRRGGPYYWEFNDLGEQHASQRGYDTPFGTNIAGSWSWVGTLSRRDQRQASPNMLLFAGSA